MMKRYQSLSDGRYYCRDCNEEEQDCTCMSQEELEAYHDEEVDRKRDEARGL